MNEYCSEESVTLITAFNYAMINPTCNQYLVIYHKVWFILFFSSSPQPCGELEWDIGGRVVRSGLSSEINVTEFSDACNSVSIMLLEFSAAGKSKICGKLDAENSIFTCLIGRKIFITIWQIV